MFRVLMIAVLLLSGSARAASCVPDATTACVKGGQFRVSASFDSNGARFAPPGASPLQGDANASLLSDDTALFSFYDADQFDLAVRVLDGCPINGYYWVFAASPSDSGLQIRVTDTNEVRTYFNPTGQAAAPILDTAAFACAVLTTGGEETSKTMAATAAGTCGHDFCLLGDRFGMDIDFDSGGSSGQAQPLAESADRSALAWLFSASNLEAVASIVDGRIDNGAFWFLASALTNAELSYTLTDTSTALQNRFHQPLGSSLTLLDRGEPLDAVLTPHGAGPGGTAALMLLIDNPYAGSRVFRAQLAAPAGATAPRFSCTASSPAVCPMASGSGDLDQSGDIPGGGALAFRFEFELPVDALVGESLPVDGTLTTLADALAGDRVTPLSAALPVVQVSTPINGAELIPVLDGSGRWIAMLLIAGLALLAVQGNARG